MAKKVRLPKKIAGVKVPRFLRKSNMLNALLGSAMGRDIAAKALTAAAGAAAAVLLEEREQVVATGEKGVKKSAKAVGLATEAVQHAASAAIGVVTDAAKSILPEDSRKGRKNKPGEDKEAITH